MASNAFGQLFRITTWGESHGKALGVVIDGCPAGVELEEEEINQALAERAPGQNPYTSPRQEKDRAEILSGVFEGKTTGAPISIVIYNQDVDTSKYDPIKNLLRPGHANFTYLEKYGVFDYRGGGRASARETVCRVAAGAVAKKILTLHNIQIAAFLQQIADIKVETVTQDIHLLSQQIKNSMLFCPDEAKTETMKSYLQDVKTQGDSIGGIVAWRVYGLPVGLGDPVYEKLEANLAKALLSLPASKGFEIGEGFAAVNMKGSLHNDEFQKDEGQVSLSSNHAGGTLGGISSGEVLTGRVVFKPTSSIMKAQKTVDVEGKAAEFNLPAGSRHDPCVAVRAVPVVEAMIALVLVDALLMNRAACLTPLLYKT